MFLFGFPGGIYAIIQEQVPLAVALIAIGAIGLFAVLAFGRLIYARKIEEQGGLDSGLR